MGRSPLFSSTSFFTFCELATTLPKGSESASSATSFPCALPDTTSSFRVSPAYRIIRSSAKFGTRFSGEKTICTLSVSRGARVTSWRG